jgi:hypothetical protein
MKLLLEPIQVSLDTQRQLRQIVWRLRPYKVKAVQEVWTYRGRWWNTPELRGQRRLYYRVECISQAGHSVSLEIFYRRNRWVLSRVLD